MSTKTFSGRADESKLAFADALTQQQLGVSFGKYCSDTLLETIYRNAALPNLDKLSVFSSKEAAVNKLKTLSENFHSERIANLTDSEIRTQIVSSNE